MFTEKNPSADSPDTSEKERLLRDCINAQLEEIAGFKWYPGTQIGHDPLQERSLGDICLEWIEKHAAEFRVYREKQQADQDTEAGG